MKRKLQIKSIKIRLTLWFIIVALAPLLAVTVIIYNQRVSYIKAEAFDRLSAIRDLKVARLNHWLEEKQNDHHTIADDYEIRGLEDTFDKQELSQDDINKRMIARELFNHYLDNYQDYFELFIINSRSGKIEISTNRSFEGADRSRDPYFTESLRSGESHFKDIYYSKTINEVTMAVSTPIHCLQHAGEHTIGILVARIDLQHSLYNLLLDRTGMGETGETLIVNKDTIALSELRWHENAPLNLKIEAEPAVMAARGATGILEATDYRGEEVLAAYSYLPETEWGFVAKQDLKEVYAPIKEMLRNMVMLLLISVVAVYGVALLLARNIARPVHGMAEVSRKIEDGDLSARNPVQRVDELGYLAESFNNMADSVGSLLMVQRGASEITEAMVAAAELRIFCEELIAKLTEVTDSPLGAFYLRSEDGKRFEHFASIGVNPRLLEPFDAERGEGEIGRALTSKKISHIKNISKETAFTFKTFTGTALPKEIVTIPISLKGEVTAIVSLASLSEYSKESMEIVDQAWPGMNTALSNMLANEETRKLAEILDEKNQELQAQTEELQAQTEELQAQTEELQNQTEELQKQNVELEAQRQQVEEANRLKSEFLSNMSHELRTPLNSIMALSRVLTMQTKNKLTEEEGNFLEVIERNGRNLLNLINDILDLSKIEAGRIDVVTKLFSVRSTIEMVVENLALAAQEKGIGIHQDIDEMLPEIESDEKKVHQILQNITGNAVKFTEQGEVTVSAYSKGGKISIEVTDTGIGIPGKYLPRIFEEFRQVDGTSSRRYEGTGLGLTIARKMARMLGGDISVKSAPGKGSTFTLILPVRWQGVEKVSEPEAFKKPIEVQPQRKTILIVDDEPEVVTMLSDYLSQEGYNTISATSGKKALMLAENHRPFAITMDVFMPDMDGWEVLLNLKKNPVTAGIPVIMVSVSDDRDTGFALGAGGHITKPVNRDELISEIYRVSRTTPYTIMVVDDNEIDRKQVADILEKVNMKIITVDGGKKCLEMVKQSKIDVLVLDLIMPEMDGFEVLDRLRTDPDMRNLPVIIVTAKDLTSEEKKVLRGNVASVLAKSNMAPNALLEEVRNVLLQFEQSHRPLRVLKKGNNILLVEDNEAAIVQIKEMLEREGYSVDVAKGGEEALGYVGRKVPDGVILDLMMPKVDGFEVLEKIRSAKATAGIPVLILTAKDLTPDDLKRLKANNIQQLVHKGDVDRQGLLFKVRLMLGRESELPSKVSEKDEKGLTPLIERREPRKAGDKKEKPTVLVIEDNIDNLLTLKAVLKDRYELLEATDGEKGVEAALTHLPDLVLLDMALPRMDGFAVVRKIKEDAKAGHIPVIALTARSMKGDREKIIEAGCDEYISKPFELEELLSKVKKFVT